MKLAIRKIERLFENQPTRRKVKVTLSNKTVIYIEPCYESWEQYGGTREELWLTVPVAERYNRWLHGGAAPSGI